MTLSRLHQLQGLLLGTAVGDALGLPREGLTRARAERMFGDELSHRFVFGRGMLSDDTEHTCMLAQAYLASRGDVSRFARSLAWRLRGWSLGLPAGVGLGTARAVARLWLGFSPERSGVFTAGNGPSMRVGVLGLVCSDETTLTSWVRAATRITHSDPRAEHAALLVALAVRESAAGAGSAEFLEAMERVQASFDDELLEILSTLRRCLAAGESVHAFADELGQTDGVSGYSYHSVPVALFAWLRHGDDFATAVGAAIRLGGDADTVGAITGAIVGAGVGPAGIPAAWIDGLVDWPRSVDWLRRLAGRLDESGEPLPLAWPLLPFRNALFLGVVLLHGFRRLLPPY